MLSAYMHYLLQEATRAETEHLDQTDRNWPALDIIRFQGEADLMEQTYKTRPGSWWT